MTEQLNKLQIKAEILTAIARLRSNMSENAAESTLQVLSQQEDKESICNILVKELKNNRENLQLRLELH